MILLLAPAFAGSTPAVCAEPPSRKRLMVTDRGAHAA